LNRKITKLDTFSLLRQIRFGISLSIIEDVSKGVCSKNSYVLIIAFPFYCGRYQSSEAKIYKLPLRILFLENFIHLLKLAQYTAVLSKRSARKIKNEEGKGGTTPFRMFPFDLPSFIIIGIDMAFSVLR
jgi:hypothetical protein